MGKLLITVTMVGALGALGALGPAVSASAAPGHAQATGTGTLGQFGDPMVHVNGIQTPAGLKGGFTVSYPDGTFLEGTATCLSVSGNTAYLTGQITSASGPREQPEGWLPGSYLVIGVKDNGDPGTAGPDLMNFSPGFAGNPGCGPNGAAVPVFPITAGNYHVFAGG